MSKVVISKTLHPEGMKALESYAPEVMPDSRVETAVELLSDAEALVLRTNIKITAEIMDKAPNLKIISRTGVGVDNVDIDAATERGIMVCNTPGVNTNSVAEQTVALIVSTAKQLIRMDQNVRAGNWKIRNSYEAVDLEGKTLGLVGMGRIGSLVAKKCMVAFNMKVIAYDPFVKDGGEITMCSEMDEVFSTADFVSIHVPYMKETHHLVDKKYLDMMKNDAYIINTSRGPLIDESALAGALESGSIAGAGLDVFEAEPPDSNNPLFKYDTVICTPHSAALTRECVRDVSLVAARQVVDYLGGKEPSYIFNKKDLALRTE